MALFKAKKQTSKQAPQQEVAADVAVVFDDAFRDELRASGKLYFEQLLADSADSVKQGLETTVSQMGGELKDYMTKQLDGTLSRMDSELGRRLDERLAEYDRITNDAQDQAVQSLNRNAQALHDKYQQLSSTLHQTIASQEAMMIGVFEENKTRMTTTQNAQESTLQLLQQNAQVSKDQSQQLSNVLRKNVADQELRLELSFTENTKQLASAFEANKTQLATVFEESKAKFSALYAETEAQLGAAKQTQSEALATLATSAQALREQSEQLAASLQQSIASQKEIMVNALDDNMARIVEHYLLGAFGEEYDMKAQLPSIIHQMEANKQAMMDDIKL